jgi:quercetin dioxygenase-like cupin family protein
VEHRTGSDVAWEPAPEQHFTGNVWFGELAPRPSPEAVRVLGVLFEPGARTDWHEHPEGQVLYVVGGAGRVQNASGETAEFSAGDVVYSAPGEAHWHGAAPGSYMMHLSLTTGAPTEWHPDKVTDEQYGSR